MPSNAYQLEGFMKMLESWGLTDVLLPFLLIFTIVFAILQKTKILGDGKKNFNVVIALVLALSVVIPHVTGSYPGGTDVVEMLNKALPNVSIVAVAFVMLLILIGLFGAESRWLGASLSGWIAIASFIIIIYIFGGAAGWWGRKGSWGWFNNFFGSDSVAIIIMVLIFGVIIWYITKPDTKGEGAVRMGNLVNDIGNYFGGKK